MIPGFTTTVITICMLSIKCLSAAESVATTFSASTETTKNPVIFQCSFDDGVCHFRKTEGLDEEDSNSFQSRKRSDTVIFKNEFLPEDPGCLDLIFQLSSGENEFRSISLTAFIDYDRVVLLDVNGTTHLQVLNQDDVVLDISIGNSTELAGVPESEGSEEFVVKNITVRAGPCQGGNSSETTQPAPATTQPAPATTQPAPVTTQPAPVTTQPAPATTEPAPVTTQPAPATTQPVPVTTQPAPTTTSTTTTTTTTTPKSCDLVADGKCFIYFSMKKSQGDAQETCTSLAGTLPEIRTEAIRNGLMSAVKSLKKDIWIGANDSKKEGTFVWNSNSEETAIPNSWWKSGAPNKSNSGAKKDCVIMKRNGKLNDTKCSKKLNFFCEF